jgi:hypothetical protein
MVRFLFVWFLFGHDLQQALLPLSQPGRRHPGILHHFGTKLRYSGASLGYQLASLTAGESAPIIAILLFAPYHSYIAIAIYIVFMAVISFASAAALKEYSSQEAQSDRVEELLASSVLADS